MSDATKTTAAVLGTQEFQTLVMEKITAIEAKLDGMPTRAELDHALRGEITARAAAIQSAIQAEQLARDNAISGLREDYKTTMQDLRSIVTVAFDAITQRIDKGYTKLSDEVHAQGDKVIELDKSVTASNAAHDQRILVNEKRMDVVEARASALFTDLKGVHDRVFGDQSKPDDKSLFAMVTALPDQITAGMALRLDTFEKKMQADTDKAVTDFVKQFQSDMNEVKEWMRSRRQVETVVWNAIKGVVSNKWVQRVVLGLLSGGGVIAALSAMSEMLRGVK